MFPHPKPKIHTHPKPKPIAYHQTMGIHNHLITFPKPVKKIKISYY